MYRHDGTITKGISTLLAVCIAVTGIFAFASLIFCILALLGVTLQLGFLSFQYPLESLDPTIPSQLLIASLFVLCNCTILGWICLVAYRMFSSINKVGTPFFDSQAKRIRLIGILTVLLATVGPIILAIGNRMLGNASTLSVNLGMLILAIIVFALAEMFDYGQTLQNLSDETL